MNDIEQIKAKLDQLEAQQHEPHKTASDTVWRIILTLCVIGTFILLVVIHEKTQDLHDVGVRNRAVICEEITSHVEDSGCLEPEVRVLWDEGYEGG